MASKMSTTTWNYIEKFVTDKTRCDECNCELVYSKDDPAEITVYTRDGTKFAQHFHKECPNRWCRKTFFYGYSVKKEKKVYETLNSTAKYLVTSRESAFAVDFCYETTLHILHNNATFQGLADVYNHFHNFKQTNLSRIELNRKRLATAFYLYGFLEFTSRSGILHEFLPGASWLENTILEYYNLIKSQFSQHWSSEHFCNVPNCKEMMVSDGGMKINRPVCAAKFSAVRKFSNSNKTILTGCTASPTPTSPFCSKHMDIESPVVLAEKLTKNTLDRLRDFRSRTKKHAGQLPNDSVYTIQSIQDVRSSPKGQEYNVKFAGFSEDLGCWEPSKNLPQFIRNFYQNSKNLGKQIPPPKIKSKKNLSNGTEMYVELEWDQSDDTLEVLKCEEDLFEIDADKLCEDEMSSCNTRKVRDKRDRRHTAGIIISATHCGKIPHVDELYGCESIKQVHGSIIEYLGTISDQSRDDLKLWLFDDMCHLKPYSEKTHNRTQSNITEMFAALAKAVDKFHFPGHKTTDKYCRTKCNPNIELKKLKIEKLNSPACEQAFKWINAFKNMKTMNEAHFKFFLLYMIDLHNLHVENNLSRVANPLHADRMVATSKVNQNKDVKENNVDAICDGFQMIDIHDNDKEFEQLNENVLQFEDCYDINQEGIMKCKFCDGTYKREGHMKNHIEMKHNKIIRLVCKCGQDFSDTKRYCRHKKSCK